MMEGIDNIMEFKEGVDYETFANNKLLKFGIFYNVTIIGEATYKLTMALQRDYIYYGLTPTNQSGALNYNVNEYISFIEVNPTTYFNIADQTETGSISDDPYIKANSVSRKKRDFTESELIDALWTKGAYNFRFEILRSTNESPQILYIPVKPSDIWNFNLDRTYRHSTAFRHSKYTYKIDPNKFTSKRFYLSPGDISLT